MFENNLHEVKCDICGSGSTNTIVPAHTVKTIQTAKGVIETTFGVAVCTECGFVFLSPRMDEKELAEYYEGQSTLHSQKIARKSKSSITVEHMQKELIDRYIEVQNETILEVGCGEGYFLSLYQNDGWKCYGIEPSSDYMEELRGLFGEERIFFGMLEEISDWCDMFHLVIMRHVLEHFRSPTSMLRKVNTLLKGGSYVYVEVPDFYQIYPAIYPYFHNEHMSYFTPVSLENALRSSGFSIEILEQFADNPSGTGKGYPVLRAIARKTPEVKVMMRNDYVNVMRVFNDYQKALLSFQEHVVKPLEREIELWIKEKRRVAIFGAGPHTMSLFEIKGIRRVNCTAIFDNNHRKWGLDICGIPVHGPGDVTSIRPDVVLISSREREDEIFAEIAEWKSRGIDVVRIYKREHDSI